MKKYLKLLPMVAFVGLVGCGETKFTCTMQFNKSTNNIVQTCNGAEFFGSISDANELKEVVNVPLKIWNKLAYGGKNTDLLSKNEAIRKAIISNKISQDPDVIGVVEVLVNRSKSEILDLDKKALGNDVVSCSNINTCNFGDLKSGDPKLYDYIATLDNFVSSVRGSASNSILIATGRNKNEVIKQIGNMVEHGNLSDLNFSQTLADIFMGQDNNRDEKYYGIALHGRTPSSLASLPTVTFTAEDLKQIESSQGFKDVIKEIQALKQQVELCHFDQGELTYCNGDLSAQKVGNGARGWNLEQGVAFAKKNDYVGDVKVEQGKITITSKGISINGDQNITYIEEPNVSTGERINWKVSDASTCLKYGLCSK